MSRALLSSFTPFNHASRYDRYLLAVPYFSANVKRLEIYIADTTFNTTNQDYTVNMRTTFFPILAVAGSAMAGLDDPSNFMADTAPQAYTSNVVTQIADGKRSKSVTYRIQEILIYP